MFVFSLKTTPRRLYGALGCLLLSLTLLGAAALLPGADSTPTAAAAAGTDDERLTYLRSLGFTADAAPVAIEEIQIPEETDAVFAEYNALQLQAGFDLTDYCGKRVKCFSYAVTAADGTQAVAHLYVYRETLIGGDITPQTEGAAMLPLQKQQT